MDRFQSKVFSAMTQTFNSDRARPVINRFTGDVSIDFDGKFDCPFCIQSCDTLELLIKHITDARSNLTIITGGNIKNKIMK